MAFCNCSLSLKRAMINRSELSARVLASTGRTPGAYQIRESQETKLQVRLCPFSRSELNL